MRRFIDLNLNLAVERGCEEEIEEMIGWAAELGYSCIGVPIPIDLDPDVTQKIRRICDRYNLDFIKRLNLAPRSVTDLLDALRSLRRRYEVIAVSCLSKNVARQAAKDRRIDLINFPSTDPRKRFFDSAEAALASKALTSLEIEMSPLILLWGFSRIQLISHLRRETLIAKKYDVPIVISSGAGDKYVMRSPRDYASLAYLFDLDYSSAIKAISENPSKIIVRNRRKLSPDYVAPGVYIVKRGRDC